MLLKYEIEFSPPGLLMATINAYLLSTAVFLSSNKNRASRYFLICLAKEMVEPEIRRRIRKNSKENQSYQECSGFKNLAN
jgi:hypothetical protein